jgi:16S rRNA U1498 N3-methylase RsmE
MTSAMHISSYAEVPHRTEAHAAAWNDVRRKRVLIVGPEGDFTPEEVSCA